MVLPTVMVLTLDVISRKYCNSIMIIYVNKLGAVRTVCIGYWVPSESPVPCPCDTRAQRPATVTLWSDASKQSTPRFPMFIRDRLQWEEALPRWPKASHQRCGSATLESEISHPPTRHNITGTDCSGFAVRCLQFAGRGMSCEAGVSRGQQTGAGTIGVVLCSGNRAYSAEGHQPRWFSTHTDLTSPVVDDTPYTV